jgi:hypothetical protein
LSHGEVKIEHVRQLVPSPDRREGAEDVENEIRARLPFPQEPRQLEGPSGECGRIGVRPKESIVPPGTSRQPIVDAHRRPGRQIASADAFHPFDPMSKRFDERVVALEKEPIPADGEAHGCALYYTM